MATTAERARSERRLIAWLIAAAAAYVAATAALRWRAEIPAWIPPLVTLATAGLAAGAFVAYRAFLRQVDELRRRIEAESMTAGYAAGVLAAILGALLPVFGLEPLDTNSVALIMMVAAGVGQWQARRRYSRPA